MPLTLTWQTIALRLTLTVIAGLCIGFNRGGHGRPAGLRTTLLVCLAASIAMIQANLLLSTFGKAPDSFVMIDVMRLPLGILSGIGFIGAGAILRRENSIVGVTTAATLWFVTVMGLCFGGGQLVLGFTALILGMIVLWGLKYVERAIYQDIRTMVAVTIAKNGPSDEDIRQRITHSDCVIISWGVAYLQQGQEREISCEIEWRTRYGCTTPPQFVTDLAHDAQVANLRWQPAGIKFDSPT
ncbi:MAG TPA: MgtC/SapB family protein [Tepidisphaeraceae bacterium]|jgi:putative Mg2+ transporter-C (MgtC) family protein|nr:MgtC/SapB family protein [Tepidisphaeraceae bacterium]